MAANRWFQAAVLIFILTGFACLFITNDRTSVPRNPISTAYEWLKNIIIFNNGFTSTWEFNKPPPDFSQGYGLSPNLSSCHLSHNPDPDFFVYCCPPNLSNEPVIDYVFPDPSKPKRIRRPLHKLDKEGIAKYTKAMTMMKALPYEDARSFARQAEMHCIFCTGAYDTKDSNVPIIVHRSWLFFPWHRMLLHFHERILGHLIGDDTFGLPFWNWDVPEAMYFPDLYRSEPFFDSERSPLHTLPNSTMEIDFDGNIAHNFASPEKTISTNLASMYNQMVSASKKWELFMGCAYKPGTTGTCDGPGTLELVPHNSVHGWIGKETNPYHENMGVFYSAGRDPLFWIHHPNIDRLWDVWRDMHSIEPDVISDPDWLDTYFYFHDEHKQLVRIKIRDVLNITKLGYSYEDVEQPWLTARPKPSVDPKIARHVLNMRNNDRLATHQSSDFGPNGRLLDTDITVKVFRPNMVRRCEKGSGEETVLWVYGIDMKKDMFVKFDVYVNAIDTNIGPESREFAGSFVSVPRGPRGPEMTDKRLDSKTNLKLGISELLEDLQADEDDFIWITLVPRGGSGVHTTVDGIRIEYMA